MRAMRGIKATAAAAGATATLILAVGMCFAIERFDGVAADQIAHIRAEENEITLAERLRWSGELIVSAGRGYLITGDPALLRRLSRARDEFDTQLKALKSGAPSRDGGQLLGFVERDAMNFLRIQELLASARKASANASELTLRFERELLPMQQMLGESLDRFVDHKESALSSIYSHAANERARLQGLLYTLLATLIAISLTTTIYFAKLVDRAYRTEQEALDAARRAIVSRDDLMGVMAHDLRTPLHAISLKALLMKKLAVTPQLHEQADSITRITRTMENLIRTMLDVTTIQAGRFSVKPVRFEVEPMLSDSFMVLEPLAKAKQIRLTRRFDQAGLAVVADRDRVLQVLANLIGNAIKFSREAGEVSLTVEQEGDMVQFNVADNGSGIHPENLPRVFDRFWKRQPDAKNGTGLGLFIARNIVEAHGGRIWVESEPGHGSKFCFTLPTFIVDRAVIPEMGKAISADSSSAPR
jgi:signal transduction histidine kinase